MRIEDEPKIHVIKMSTVKQLRWMATIEGECPNCGRQSLIKYVDDDVLTGCLRCGWKELDSIERSIQKALDQLRQTLERIATS